MMMMMVHGGVWRFEGVRYDVGMVARGFWHAY